MFEEIFSSSVLTVIGILAAGAFGLLVKQALVELLSQLRTWQADLRPDDR